MNWSEIKGIKAWSPIESVTVEAAEIDKGLYRIGDQDVLMTQPYDAYLNEGMPGAPFIIAAYWAGSVDSIRHCILQEVESVDVLSPLPPPSELLSNTGGTYSEFQNMREGKASEIATYRGVDGVFINKSIVIDRFRYYYLGKRIDPFQLPYVIEISLMS